MSNIYQVKSLIVRELGLQAHKINKSTVNIIQSKIYLFNQFHDLGFNFIFQSKTYSKDLALFLRDTYPFFADYPFPRGLRQEIQDTINKINDLSSTKLASELGDEKTYGLLASIVYVNKNQELWQFEDNFVKEDSDKNFVQKIVSDVTTHSKESIDNAWMILEELDLLQK